MHGRLVDNLLLKRSVQLTCSLVTIFYWSWTYKLLWHSKNVSDGCWPECGVLISSTSYSGFYLSLVRCHSFEKRWKHYSSIKFVCQHKYGSWLLNTCCGQVKSFFQQQRIWNLIRLIFARNFVAILFLLEQTNLTEKQIFSGSNFNFLTRHIFSQVVGGSGSLLKQSDFFRAW